MPIDPKLEPFSALVGAWEIEATHPMVPGGVHRIYQVSLSGKIWRMWRHSPGFSQTFEGRLSGDGNTIEGLWKLSRDDTTWDHDLAITFRRR